MFFLKNGIVQKRSIEKTKDKNVLMAKLFRVLKIQQKIIPSIGKSPFYFKSRLLGDDYVYKFEFVSFLILVANPNKGPT